MESGGKGTFKREVQQRPSSRRCLMRPTKPTKGEKPCSVNRGREKGARRRGKAERWKVKKTTEDRVIAGPAEEASSSREGEEVEVGEA